MSLSPHHPHLPALCAQYIKQGGVQAQVQEKSRADLLVDVALGKAKKGSLKDKKPESIQEAEAAKLAGLEK